MPQAPIKKTYLRFFPLIHFFKRIYWRLGPICLYLYSSIRSFFFHPNSIFLPPLSNCFGVDLGTPIDRVYILRFLQDHQSIITGDVAEFGESVYTRRFATPPFRPFVLHGSDAHAYESYPLFNLESLNGFTERYDAIICTNVLNFVFDVNSSIEALSFITKPQGFCLITVACISPLSLYDASRWGDFWRFTPQSLERLLCKYFNKVELSCYGNQTSAACFIKGIPAEYIPPGLLYPTDNISPLSYRRSCLNLRFPLLTSLIDAYTPSCFF